VEAFHGGRLFGKIEHILLGLAILRVFIVCKEDVM
jgi:hypothetical protein